MERELLLQEISYRTARSGGSGGQHVNKVETKVEALLDVRASNALSDDEKKLIFEKLANRINSEGILYVSHQTARSQWDNKQFAVEKMLALISKALKKSKKRLKSSIPPEIKEAIRKSKKRQSEKKAARRKVIHIGH